MIARLIKEGCGFERCDIVVLNHFYEAEEFCRKARETRAWENVTYLDDDGSLDRLKIPMGPIRKFFFYQRWKRYLPEMLADISGYDEAFIAHDFVAVEYAIMRHFSKQGKRARLFEEGFGNYIDNSTHKTWGMRLLKRMAPLLGLPGGVFGSVRWIESIWLQRPELFLADLGGHRALKRKARPLPMRLKEFLQTPRIVEELYWIYPELREIDRQVQGSDSMTVVLTEPFIDQIEERDTYLREILNRVNGTRTDTGGPVFFKQHPGELKDLERFDRQISVLPKRLPIELLYLIAIKNDIRKLNLYSFGSTAILNLYDLCRHDGGLDIYIFESMSMREEVKLIATRFCDLARTYRIRYHSL